MAAEPAEETINKSGKRPRLDLDDGGARKRGKSIFGLVLGTLKQAKNDEGKRGMSDAAKKRALIDQRLQSKLRNETDAVRKVEEAKKDRSFANRKEEDLQLKDSLFKLRKHRLQHLSNFLLTSDDLSDIDNAMPDASAADSPKPAVSVLASLKAPRSHPPPLYYLPAILLPAQDAFLKRRKEGVVQALSAEWSAFKSERTASIEEIRMIRESVEATKAEAATKQQEADAAAKSTAAATTAKDGDAEMKGVQGDADADMDESGGDKEKKEAVAATEEKEKEAEEENKAEAEEKEREKVMVPLTVDDDDAVEY